MLIRPRYLRRYRQIVSILFDYGFGAALNQLGLGERLNIPRRVRKRKVLADDTYSNPRRLRLALEELGPTFIKGGQILSARSDLLPPEYIEELSYLQDRVAPVSWDKAAAVIEFELGKPVTEIFREFDTRPIAAASLAQVYNATLFSGEQVVVKVQRPGIEEVINTDLDIMFDLAKTVQEHTEAGYRHDVADLAQEFAWGLRGELDFRREGRSADQFRENFKDEQYLKVPNIFWDYTTRRVLVMERLEGIKIDDLAALDAAGYNRHELSARCADIILKEVMLDGYFHADPHPGNLMVLPGGVIGVLDFGTMGRLDERDRANLARLFINIVSMDVNATVDQLQHMRIVEYHVDTNRLAKDLRRVLLRYYGLPIYEIAGQDLFKEVQPLIYEYKLRVPSDYWLLIKTAIIMQGVGLKLDPEFDIFGHAQPYLAKLFRRAWAPSSWGPGILRFGMEWKDLAAELPRKMNRITDQLERGDLTVKAELPQLQPIFHRVDIIVNRVINAIILAALIVGLAFLVPRLDFTWPWPLVTWIILVAFVVAFFVGARLVWSALRGRSWKIRE
jgi:ubiquinone biosynthesis protein